MRSAPLAVAQRPGGAASAPARLRGREKRPSRTLLCAVAVRAFSLLAAAGGRGEKALLCACAALAPRLEEPEEAAAAAAAVIA